MIRSAPLALLTLLVLQFAPALALAQGTPITRAQRFTGNINFVTTGGSLRTQPNTGDSCAVGTTNTAALTGIPAGTSIRAAYLYWGGSGATIDSNVTLNGSAVAAQRTFTAIFNTGGTNYPYFGGVADVTTRVTGNGNFTFSGLTVNTGAPHCASSAVAAGWGLVVVYQGTNERLRAINIFDGLQFFRGSALTLTPDGFRVPPSNIDGRVAVITWEGDPQNSLPLNGFAESLTFNGTLLDDGLVPAGSDPVVQQFDGTINSIGNVNSYGVDVDIYDVTPLLSPGQTSATTVYSSGGDLVLLTAQIVSVTTEPVVDLGITKTHTGNFAVGSNGQFTITVSNAAGVERDDNVITVTDTLPAGLGFVAATGTGWACGASGQTVTCTHPPFLNSGASLPPINLTVAVSAAAAPSVANTATVSSPSLDINPANDSATDTVVVLAPNLSTSTKTVVDVNGGEVAPGDSLRYTVTLRESGGVIATLASMQDDVPANTAGFSIVSLPPGAINTSTPGGGANGTGVVNVTNITVPANGTATVVFDVVVSSSATPGTTIDNSAVISQPNGPGATPAAPTMTVLPSQIPGSGTKPLYLHTTPALDLSRLPPSPAESFATINAGQTLTWALTPPLQLAVDLPAGNIAVPLWLRRAGSSSSRTITVTLANSATGTIGSTTQSFASPSSGDPVLVNVTLPNPTAQSFPAGSLFTLAISHDAPGGSRQTLVFPNGVGAGNVSRVELNSNTVINVDSVTMHTAAYPSTAVASTFLPGATIHIRAVVSDPFGSFDIAGARLTLVDGNGATQVNNAAMAQVADNGAALRTYEFAYTVPLNGAPGVWTANVTATEGSEGTVTDLGVGTVTIAPLLPTLAVAKTSSAFSDPYNGTSNPLRVPGGVTRYTITVTNSGPGNVDSGSLTITDVVPQNTALYVGPVNGPAVQFTDGATASGLSLGAVAYSNQPGGGAPFNYTPSPDGGGFDGAVTGIQVTLNGTMAAVSGANQPSFSIAIRVRVD
ncbi:MAG: hypothetical protein R3E77_12930 [Steroidobacteraceae bacterium]